MGNRRIISAGAQSEAETQSAAKPASILKKNETSPGRFLSIESKTGNWRRDRKDHQ
jgi:hypothetical protein